ncbi:MAG: DNA-3-methyladenine glycosylase [Nitrosopumilus sp.]|uniref:DNA-3-methyladenine glycosylase n=1 Tax=Nitrosopumilus sp. TaxID=2024843 RepID=UPI00247CE81C|nr:DNA-3-methyladenine glycosylase [Nitrosopumilus sp.]MCV0392485.1 DNA-3-methyladenine glycosylase [Nitrosopumilus sp.]
MNILPRDFYLQDTVTVAKNLLGKRLVRKIGRVEVSGIIIETEAYKHKEDPASHAFRNITERNKAMFGEVGHSYVYFTYGMHYCFNVVARNSKTAAGAVLIRAIMPEKGIEKMIANRKISDFKNLTNGPAKLTQALEITKEHYGVDLTKNSKLFITEGAKPNKIIKSSRIGIREATEKLWNFKSI